MGYKASQQHKQRMEKLHRQTRRRYFAGVYFDEQKKYYVRYTQNNPKDKRICRRATRRKLKYQEGIQYSQYKKEFDYQYMVL